MAVIHAATRLVSKSHVCCTGFEESHKTFRRSLAEGYSWEVLEVWSG